VNSSPIRPLLAVGERLATLQAQAPKLPRLDVDDRTAADLELLGNGGFTPLTGFLGKADYDSVVERMRLADGRPWSIPITLAVTQEQAEALNSDDVALWHGGRPVAVIHVKERFGYDKAKEARNVFKTEDVAHPGVAVLMKQGDVLFGGPVEVIAHDIGQAFPTYRLTPTQTREEFAKRGWKRIVAFQTRNPIHRAHEYLTKCALEMVDGLLIHPLVGETKSDDVAADVRMRCYEALMEHHYPKARVILSVFPFAMRYAGPREAILHALVRKNYGATHFIVGRDHAGVGNYYGTYDAQRIFDEFADGELGIQPIFFEHTFYCRDCEGIASSKTCHHDEQRRIAPSGTKVREMLRAGEAPPPEFSRPSVAKILIEAMRAKDGAQA
jgi:sulfate adenylyltransferase